MGFWNKLGKIALQAAPYVAAPFTGGASLMATGATQKLGQKWAEHDAKNAVAKGLAPSKFDKILGGISMGAGLASSMGMGGAITGLSKAGAAANAARAAGTASKLSGFQSALGKIGTGASIAMGAAPRGQGTEMIPGGGGNNQGGLSGWQGQLASIGGDLLRDNIGHGGADTPSSSQNAPPVGSNSNQAMPRPSGLAAALARGKSTAIVNQPYRQGYDTVIQGPEEGQTITQRMPPIYPNYGPPPSDNGAAPPSIFNQAPQGTPIANRFGDALTQPRVARKRNPEPVQEEY